MENYNGGNPSSSKRDVYEGLFNYYLYGTSTVYSVEDLAGVSTVSYTDDNVEYTRTYFVSNPDNVMVAHLDTDSNDGVLDFTVSLSSKQNGQSTSSENGTIVCSGEVSNNKLLHSTTGFYWHRWYKDCQSRWLHYSQKCEYSHSLSDCSNGL